MKLKSEEYLGIKIYFFENMGGLIVAEAMSQTYRDHLYAYGDTKKQAFQRIKREIRKKGNKIRGD